MLRANFLCFSLVPDALVIIPGSILAYFFSTRAQTQKNLKKKEKRKKLVRHSAQYPTNCLTIQFLHSN